VNKKRRIHIMVSKAFIVELLADRRPRKELEAKAGVAPGTVKKILTGDIRPRRGDPRVIALGRALGLSLQQCFYEYKPEDYEESH
jgi:hypothetical protein